MKRTINQLIPIVAEAPAVAKTRNRWLERLWQAILDDGVSYLSPVPMWWRFNSCAMKDWPLGQ